MLNNLISGCVKGVNARRFPATIRKNDPLFITRRMISVNTRNHRRVFSRVFLDITSEYDATSVLFESASTSYRSIFFSKNRDRADRLLLVEIEEFEETRTAGATLSRSNEHVSANNVAWRPAKSPSSRIRRERIRDNWRVAAYYERYY